MHCCAEAVSTLMQSDWDDYCNVNDFPMDGDLEFNDGTDTCTMLSGTVETRFTNADGELVESIETAQMIDQIVDNRMCCLAFDPDSLDKFDVELQYACEELESRNVTSVYDTGAGMCTTTTEVAMYVDFNADGMYMWAEDGDLFDRLPDVIENDDDACCMDAINDENFAVMDMACDKDEVETDHYFTFDDTLTCTMRFDRDTSYFLKS